MDSRGGDKGVGGEAAAEGSPPRQPVAGSQLRRLRSDELFDGATEVEITHLGAVYRLRLTRQGKLILNK